MSDLSREASIPGKSNYELMMDSAEKHEAWHSEPTPCDLLGQSLIAGNGPRGMALLPLISKADKAAALYEALGG
jgi:hypothetical protein